MADDTTDPNVPSVAAVPDVNGIRDGLGRFGPGNKFGAGKLTQSRMSQYRRAFHAAVTDEDMQAIARAMVGLAVAGDVPAARYVTEQCIGKVLEAEIEVDAQTNPGQLVINLVGANRN